MFRRISTIVLISISTLVAQTPTQTADTGNPGPAFEASTLKPNNVPGVLTLFPRRSGDSFTWNNAPLSMVMAYAYEIPITRIEGLQTNGFYSVAARIDPSATNDQVRQMLQGLLVERLKITAHRETRKVKGLELVVAKTGQKMKIAAPSADPPPMPDFLKQETVTSMPGQIVTLSVGRVVRGVAGRGVSTRQLADELSKILALPVSDRTGLTGNYYFDFLFQPDDTSGTQASMDAGDDAPTAETIFSALQDRLGLRLQKSTVPAEYLVIEHSEKPSGQ